MASSVGRPPGGEQRHSRAAASISITLHRCFELSTTGRPPSNTFAFCLDAVLFVFFVLLRTPKLTGLPWHEWLGVAFVVPMLVHLLQSWRWIVTALRRAFSPARRRDAVNLLLNVSLFITTVGVVVSGLLISRVALPALGIATIDDRVWRETHNNWTDAMLVSVAAHIAMNFRWIIKVTTPYLPRWLKEVL
ncbi:MAG: DUF4405 domain-containing protein [Gemmatimonadaceae bacterium]